MPGKARFPLCEQPLQESNVDGVALQDKHRNQLCASAAPEQSTSDIRNVLRTKNRGVGLMD